jgi:protein-tyrosine sulfotransferase
MTNVFFIVGCQRSGTTMLESILNAHPKVRVVGEEESESYKYLSKEKDPGELSAEYVGLRIPMETHGIYQVTKHEGARVLFTLRDPRDVAASMLRHVTRDLSWIERYAQREIARTMLNLPDRARLEQQFERLHDEIDDDCDVRFAAFLWALKNRYIPIYSQLPLPTKIVRYEVLVSSPDPYLRQICDHLGLEWSNRLLEHGKHNTGTWAGTNKAEPIHSRSIASHKSGLTLEDRRKVHSVIQAEMEMLGYVELFD